jgi:tRNA threonylcarbamoyladenosine biosynthesis protein TsaE
VIVVESASLAETAALGRAFADQLVPGDVVGLIGPLGAGKTRLAREIAEALGADPLAISSPTFVLIHEYPARVPIYHFDAYRLASPDEFAALGALDDFEAGGICLIEWADRVLDLLPPSAWLVEIEATDLDSRRFRIRADDEAISRLVLKFDARAGSTTEV